jgi:hypothetical protein
MPIQIKTKTSMDVMKKYYEEIKIPAASDRCSTPLSNIFPDVPSEFWASCDINKLTEKSVIAGYLTEHSNQTSCFNASEFASLIAKDSAWNRLLLVTKQCSLTFLLTTGKPSVEKAVETDT